MPTKQNPRDVIKDLLTALNTLEQGWRILYLIPAEDKLPRIVQVAIQNAKDYLKEQKT